MIQKDARGVCDALDFGRHRYHEAGAPARVDHLFGPLRRRVHQPFGAVHATKFRIEERPLEVNAEAARAQRAGLFEIVRRFDDVRRRMQHGFVRRGHHRCDESGPAHLRVVLRGGRDGVAVIPIEQKLADPVGVHVDEARGDRAARRQRVVGRSTSREHALDSAVNHGQTPVR